MNIDKIEVTKKIVNIIVATGTSKIVGSIIKNNTTADSVTDKVAMTAGAAVLGMMAADASSNYTDAKIDEIVAWWRVNVKSNH